MKKNYAALLVILLFSASFAQAQYDQQNISLLGHWFNPAQTAEPTYGIKYNSVHGWVDPVDHKEYAIIGSSSGTYFVDVTTAASPILIDYVAGRRNNCIWREYKTYGNYLYASSDDGSPNSFQIMDLSYLPDSVHVISDNTTYFERSHTLYIDGNKLYCGSVTMSGGTHYSMMVFSLNNPTNPVLLRKLNQDFPAINHVHDMLVRNDTVYASCGYQGFYIYRYDSVANTFSELNNLTSYPDQGYNHSSTITPDGHTMVFCDEVPAGMAVKVIDVADIANIGISSTFESNPGATPHNPYIKGKDRVIIAYYQDGVQIYDISNPASPVRTGYFDTDTLHGLNDNYPGAYTYHGAWGAYIELPSGVILSSDMQNGLYILDASQALVGIHEQNAGETGISVYPNPTTGKVNISLQLAESEKLAFEICDLSGRRIISEIQSIASGNAVTSINTNGLNAGIYFLKIKGRSVNYAKKIVKE